MQVEISILSNIYETECKFKRLVKSPDIEPLTSCKWYFFLKGYIIYAKYLYIFR